MERSVESHFRNAAIYALARLLPGGLSLVTTVVLTRALDTDTYGRFSLTISLAILISALVYNWIGLAIARFLPSMRVDAALVTREALLGFGMITVVIIAFAASWLLFGVPDSSNRIADASGLFVLVLISQGLWEVSTQLISASIQPVRYAVAAGMRSLAWFLAALGVWGAGLGLVGLLVCRAVSNLLGALSGSWALWLRGFSQAGAGAIHRNSDSGRDLKPEREEIARYVVPLSMSVLCSLALAYSDRFLLAYFRDVAIVGTYAAANDLTQQGVGALLAAIAMGSRPLVFRASGAGDNSAVDFELRHFLDVMLSIGLPCTIGFAILGGGLAVLTLGEAYRESAQSVIPLLTCAVWFSALRSHYADLAFHLQRKTWPIFLILLAAIALNTMFNFFLIPSFGEIGAAWATVLSYAFALGLSLWVGHRMRPLPINFGQAMRVLSAGAIMALFLGFFARSESFFMLTAYAVAGVFVYSFTLFLTGYFRGMRAPG